MIRGRVESLNESGSGGIKKRTSEGTDCGKDERRDRVKRLENKRQNTRNAGQTSVRTGRGRGTIVSGT